MGPRVRRQRPLDARHDPGRGPGDDRRRHAAAASSTWPAWAPSGRRPARPHYAASKAAVVALTQAAAVELGPHAITVNAICPGYVLTEMGAATRTPEMVAAWSATSPLGRCAEPADVARMALFLASDDAAYCTGQAFNVTGGMIMH